MSVESAFKVSVGLLNEVIQDPRTGSSVVQRLEDLIYLDGQRFRRSQQG